MEEQVDQTLLKYLRLQQLQICSNKSFLLTGDNSSSKNIKASYQKYGNLMKVDVLKNPHHNSSIDITSNSIRKCFLLLYK